MIERKELNCEFCEHKWFSRIEPKVCPQCHNDWRKKRKENATKK